MAYFKRNSYGEVVVYVDGACPGNGTRRARGGVGVWFDDGHQLNWSSGLPGVQTNNNAEIYAAVKAIEILLDFDEYNVEIKSDSTFLRDCMTLWIERWKSNGWKARSGKTVANKYMLQQLDRLMKLMNSVTFTYVRGHSDEHGNEEADLLARQGADENY